MDTYKSFSYGANAWQASFITIQIHLKNEVLAARNRSALSHQSVPRKLTTEAYIMLCTIFLFIILTAMGSSITVYEKYKKVEKESYSTAKKSETKVKNEVICIEEEKKLYETSMITGLKKFLTFFCIISNARRTFNISSKDEQLICLHGIKAISVLWAIIVHACMLSDNVLKTSESYQFLVKKRMTLFLYNGICVVDTFFVLGGFLNAYTFCHRYDKGKGKFSWTSFYARRFLRISPLCFFVIGFYSTLFSYLGSGVLWPTYNTNPVCKKNWIWHALYLSNFNSPKNLCMVPTWYLPCEMQLYIISPIFLILLMRKPKTGYALIVLGICGSCLINFICTKHYKLVDGPRMFSDYYPNNVGEFYRRYWVYFDMLYMKPLPRLGSYLTGLTLGHYLYQKKFKPTKWCSQVTLSLGWITAAIFLWITIFSLYGREESAMEFAVYNGLKHLLFSCSVAWVIYACATGQGGFVTKFLSNKVFIVISSISFAIYLTHYAILERYYLMNEELVDFSVMLSVLHFALQCLQIFIVSAAVSTVFEAPMSRITELFLNESKQELNSIKQN